MKNTRIAKRYAKALFDLAKEQELIDAIYQDMSLLFSVCKTSREFRVMLSNPIIKADKKQAVLTAIFEKEFNKLSMAYVSIIARKRREIYFESISEQFIDLYKELKNIKTVTFKAAIDIDETMRKKIQNLLGEILNAEIDLIEETEPDIIGGFVLSVDDKQFDASIITKIKKLNTALN